MADTLKIGTVGPDFTLVTNSGESFHLKDYRDKKNILMVFYPKNNTSG